MNKQEIKCFFEELLKDLKNGTIKIEDIEVDLKALLRVIESCDRNVMNTYLVKSETNYGEVVHVVNADNEGEVRIIVKGNDNVWDGYGIEKVDTKTRGIVSVCGGGD